MLDSFDAFYRWVWTIAFMSTLSYRSWKLGSIMSVTRRSEPKSRQEIIARESKHLKSIRIRGIEPRAAAIHSESETRKSSLYELEVSSFAETEISNFPQTGIRCFSETGSPNFSEIENFSFFSVADTDLVRPVRGGNVSRYTISDCSLFVLKNIYIHFVRVYLNAAPSDTSRSSVSWAHRIPSHCTNR
jgi:hypothetical protein